MFIGERLRGALRSSVPGASEVLNVFWWTVTSPDTDANGLSAIGTWALTGFGPQWQAAVTTSCTLIDIDVDVIASNGTVVRNLGTVTINLTGSLAQDNIVGGAGALLVANTAQPGVRGRKTIAGLSENNVTTGFLDAALVTLLGSMLTQYYAVINTAGAGVLTPGVVSRATGTFWPFTGSGYVSDVPAYQRRRKPNVGS